MYETFYQLSAEPFRLSPDPWFCFQHQSYRKAMTYMLHALHRAEGFIMITGRPGTGKTTLISDLIQRLKPDQTVVAKIVSTQLTANDLLDLVAYSFNIDPGGRSKANVLIQVERFLKQQYQNGRRALLIVDEAQDMRGDALEELRLLTNIQLGNHQLLQVFLVGQQQLRDTVNTPSLEQLHQRLIAATHLEPLDTDNTLAYIKHRLRRVNWKGDPLISTEAYALIQRYSHGIPRKINQICSRLLLHGCIEEKHRLGIADLKIVVEELQQEMLLPMDKGGINEAAPWPTEPYEETYETEAEPNPPAPETAPPTTPKTVPEAEGADHKPSTMMADTGLHTPERGPVSVTGPDQGAGDDHNGEDPADTMGTRNLGSWKLIGLSGLLAGLVLALMSPTRTQFTWPPDQKPDTSRHASGQMASIITAGNLSHKMTATDEDTRTGLVVRTSAGSDGPKRDLSDNETTLQEPQKPSTRIEIQALGLEKELQLSGLLIERLNSNLLKINLSSYELFDFDSAQMKDDAHSVLEKLADVLRQHGDLTLQIAGHADTSGPAEYNRHLSQLRAKAVADYLINQGLADSSIHIQSEGRSDQDTGLNHSVNNSPSLHRRVEMYIRRVEEK